MQKPVLPITFLLIVSLSGCATTNTRPQKYYSHTEFNKMTYCVGMSDTAMYVATEKLKHRPKVQLNDYYSTRPNAQLNIAIVNEVYAANFSSAWDYTVRFFNDCALHLAGVTANRVSFASYCEQNTLIADIAYGYKKYGYPKQQAYKQFDQFNSKTPNQIVDRVYASNQGRAETKLGVWNSCMAKISNK